MPVNPADPAVLESVLREELARGDAMAETVLPILRHLIANDDNSVFSDEILARVRGMASGLASELLDARAVSRSGPTPSNFDPAEHQSLVSALIGNPAFLSHIHALALEWQLTERMQRRLALDPVVPPLLQALIASAENPTQGLAMKLLAAQSRFCQGQQRMALPLCELPADLLHHALLSLRGLVTPDHPNDRDAIAAETTIRSSYDEGAGRLGLISQLVLGMGSGMAAALSLTHAGVAIFLTALAIGSGSGRDPAVLATHEAQQVRLALGLRAAGLRPEAINQQILALHPESTLSAAFDTLGAEQASAMLSAVNYRER